MEISGYPHASWKCKGICGDNNGLFGVFGPYDRSRSSPQGFRMKRNGYNGTGRNSTRNNAISGTATHTYCGPVGPNRQQGDVTIQRDSFGNYKTIRRWHDNGYERARYEEGESSPPPQVQAFQTKSKKHQKQRRRQTKYRPARISLPTKSKRNEKFGNGKKKQNNGSRSQGNQQRTNQNPRQYWSDKDSDGDEYGCM